MQPYQYGNAFAQQRYLREQAVRTSTWDFEGSTLNDTTPTKTTTLRVPVNAAEEVSTPGTTMDDLVGPVTETEAAGRAAVVQQRADMEQRLRSPTRSPRRRRNTTAARQPSVINSARPDAKRRDTAPSNESSTNTENGNHGPKTPFLNKIKTAVLRGRKSQTNLQQPPGNTMPDLPANLDKPLPTLTVGVYPNLLQVAYPSSPIQPPTPATPLNPTAPLFSPGRNWPLGNDFPVLQPHPPSSATSATTAVYLSPSPAPRALHPDGIIATTAMGNDYITPIRGGTYGVAGRAVLVGGMQHAISMKGSILEIGDVLRSELADTEVRREIENGHGPRIEELEGQAEEETGQGEEDEENGQSEEVPVKMVEERSTVNELRAEFASMLGGLANVQDRLWGIEGRSLGVEGELGTVGARLARVEARLANVDAKLDRMEAKMDRFFTEHTAQIKFGQSFGAGRYPGRGY